LGRKKARYPLASGQSSPEKPISQPSHDQLSSPFWRIRREAKEEKGETVDLKSLPAAIQHTIKEKAPGGEIVRVKGKTTRLANGTMRSL
jgi:hypothetical protein